VVRVAVITAGALAAATLGIALCSAVRRTRIGVAEL